jgi:negative regulator of sigma E activity
VSWSPDGSASALVDVVRRAGEGTLLRPAPTPQSPEGNAVYKPDAEDVERSVLALLTRNYEAEVEGRDSVAGRPVDVVVVRRSGSSPLARLWLDTATRLVLRREDYDSDGRTLRASAFVRIELAQPGPSEIRGADPVPGPAGRLLSEADLATMRGDGWQAPVTLPHGLELLVARFSGEGDEQVLHLTYSDGVSSVSLFEQRGLLDRDSLDGWRQTEVGDAKVYEKQTYPRRMVWSGEGTVFTLVAECQQPTLEGVVAAFPHGEPGRGVLNRLGRGLSRVGSWFNPFG